MPKQSSDKDVLKDMKVIGRAGDRYFFIPKTDEVNLESPEKNCYQWNEASQMLYPADSLANYISHFRNLEPYDGPIEEIKNE